MEKKDKPQKEYKDNKFTKIPDFDVCSAMSAVIKAILTADSFASFFAATEDFFHIVMTMRSRGPDNIRSLIAGIKDVFDDYAREKMEKRDNAAIERLEHELKRAREETEFAYKTGDQEFDNFRKKLRYHDWFAGYSDDGNVWRAAEQQMVELKKIAAEKGEKYQQAIEDARVFHCRSVK